MINNIKIFRAYYKKYGVHRLILICAKLLLSKVITKLHMFKLWIKYTNIDSKIHIDPSKINYKIPSDRSPKTLKNKGIIGGDWDINKKRFWTGPRKALKERFAENKSWTDTDYYKIGMRKLGSGEEINRLDFNKQSTEEFHTYLEELDNLYDDIRDNGYDYNYPITIYIGRHGEILLRHGNHRTVISKILGLEEIPAIVVYRHKEWQKKREKFETYDTQSEVPRKYSHLIDHPDIPFTCNE